MKKNLFTHLLQASLMCCLAVLFTACDEIFGNEDYPVPAYLSINEKPVTIKVGEYYTRTALTTSRAVVEYSSSDETVAAVDNQGKVYGVAAGTATITATATGKNVDGKETFLPDSKSYVVTVTGGSAPAPSSMLATALTLEAAEAGAIVKFKSGADAVAKVIEYSLDGTTWTARNTGGGGVSIILVNAGDKVMFRGTNGAYSDGISQNSITCDKDCYIYGNIMSLIKAEGFENETALTGDNNFCRLFKDNTHVKNHTDATKYLVLPAITLTNDCYNEMFSGCTALTAAPALLATTLTIGCYNKMFFGCTALATAPDLPAPTLTMACYNSMFQGCTGLTTTPVLNVDCNGEWGCMPNMFNGCTGLTTVAAGSQIKGNMGINCCAEMFSGCTALASVPSDLLPATTLNINCYNQMFNGCEALTAAPALPATTLENGCYYKMFNGCTILNKAWVKANYSIANAECNNMFNGVAATGTMHCKTGSNWGAQKATAGIGGWTVNENYN